MLCMKFKYNLDNNRNINNYLNTDNKGTMCLNLLHFQVIYFLYFKTRLFCIDYQSIFEEALYEKRTKTNTFI